MTLRPDAHAKMESPKQMFTMCQNDLHGLQHVSTPPDLIGEQYPLPYPTWWFGDDAIATDGFGWDLPQSSLAPWFPTVLDVGTTEQHPVCGADGFSSYPLAPLEPEPSPSSTAVGPPPQHDGLSQEPEPWGQVTNDCDVNVRNDKKRKGSLRIDTEVQSPKRLRTVLPTPPSVGSPKYIPPVVLRRYSASDTHEAALSPYSATTASPDSANAYWLSSFSSATDTSTTPISPAVDDDNEATTQPQPSQPQTAITSATAATDTNTRNRAKTRANTTTTSTTTAATTTTSSPRRASAGTATATAGSGSGSGSRLDPQQARDRNRAAASRYRAKTQAALAQLEASEREARLRRQVLLARAGRLRDEVFALKNELLRHAGCDCPLIRGYLSHAAERACEGLRTGGFSAATPAGGGGGGDGFLVSGVLNGGYGGFTMRGEGGRIDLVG